MNDYRQYFQKLNLKLVGIGVTAFNRVIPAFFLPSYQIVCYKNSQELAEIEKKCPLISIEKNNWSGVETLNSLAILLQPDVQAYLKGLKQKLGIFVYKSSEAIYKLCLENSWQLIANPPEVRDPFENKKIFRETLEKVGLEPIPGEVFRISDFNEAVFEKLQQKYGTRLVLKLPEVRQGGGIGLTFVEQKRELSRFWERVERFKKLYNLQYVIIEKQIEGISPSITGCITRFGVLSGIVQTQITDIGEVIDIKRGGGMFVGHDWSYRHYSEKIQNQARQIAKKFGEYLYQKGYRGIFGIDLIVEDKTDKVYPCECNPRLTGAFPVYSMMQLKQGEPPFDIFHLLEHLNIDYQMDFPTVQQVYRQKKEGAHLILNNKTAEWLKIEGEIKAGVYRWTNGQLVFVRPGFSLLDIQEPDEFVLTDGVPFKGEIIKPNLRILKIIFPRKILTTDGKKIDERTQKIVELVYQCLKLTPVPPPKEEIVEEMEF